MARFKTGVFYVLLGMAGCGLVKRNKEKNIEKQKVTFEGNVKQSLGVENSKVMQSFLLEKDAAEAEFMVEIWPRGPFNYSPYKGFEGTAQKIIWFGKAAEASSALLHQQVEQEQKATAQIDMGLKTQQQYDQRQMSTEVTKSAGWKWILAGIVIGLALVLWVWNKRK